MATPVIGKPITNQPSPHFPTFAGLLNYPSEQGSEFNSNNQAQQERAVAQNKTWALVLPGDLVHEDGSLEKVQFVRLVKGAFSDDQDLIPVFNKLIGALANVLKNLLLEEEKELRRKFQSAAFHSLGNDCSEYSQMMAQYQFEHWNISYSFIFNIFYEAKAKMSEKIKAKGKDPEPVLIQPKDFDPSSIAPKEVLKARDHFYTKVLDASCPQNNDDDKSDSDADFNPVAASVENNKRPTKKSLSATASSSSSSKKRKSSLLSDDLCPPRAAADPASADNNSSDYDSFPYPSCCRHDDDDQEEAGAPPPKKKHKKKQPVPAVLKEKAARAAVKRAKSASITGEQRQWLAQESYFVPGTTDELRKRATGIARAQGYAKADLDKEDKKKSNLLVHMGTVSRKLYDDRRFLKFISNFTIPQKGYWDARFIKIAWRIFRLVCDKRRSKASMIAKRVAYAIDKRPQA
eukprot:3706951-Rhodomonas_salina.2